MPKASVTRLIERDKKTLINFVLDIEKYPEFIPFCISSKVYEKKEVENSVNIIADLKGSLVFKENNFVGVCTFTYEKEAASTEM